MKPFGVLGTRTPVFLLDDLTISNKFLMGKNKEHLKITVKNGEYEFDAIQFNSELNVEVGQNIKMLATLNVNEFRG